MRIIICSGSGGSGVTTLAAATAVASAGRGKRTLVFGLNPGLAGAFAIDPAEGPVKVADSLWVMEIHHSRDSTDEFRDWMMMMLDWRGMEVELADDLAALPGMNHVGRLLELESLIDSEEYDVVVVDAAPLSQFLDLPPALDASARWLARLFAPRQANVFEPFLRVFAGEYASAGEDVLERGQQLLGRLAALRERFTNNEATSVRLVLRADEEAVELARRSATTLALFGYHIDAVTVNRLLGDEVTDTFFDASKVRQARTLNEMQAALGDLPVLTHGLEREPPRGAEGLEGVGAAVYEGWDALGVLYRPATRSFSRNGAGYELLIPLPLAEREELDLEETEEGVAVHLGGRRCVLPLPEEGRYYDRASWSLDGGVLKVVFER
jgi:arsenite-transporting ATPase